MNMFTDCLLEIHLFNGSYKSILKQLNYEGIKFSETELFSSSTPQIVLGIFDLLKTATIWSSLATILVTWIKSKYGRKVAITNKDKSIIQIEGMSISDIERLLKNSCIISVFESNEKESMDENKDI